jgi:hypothetical protein
MGPVASLHSPEPGHGTVLTADGRQADLFNTSHYPVRAVCRMCSEPIQADSFFRPFEHVDGQELAEVIPFPVRGDRRRVRLSGISETKPVNRWHD